MLLMEEAERIAYEEHGSHKISVISGIVVWLLHSQCVNWYFVCNSLYIMLIKVTSMLCSATEVYMGT